MSPCCKRGSGDEEKREPSFFRKLFGCFETRSITENESGETNASFVNPLAQVQGIEDSQGMEEAASVQNQTTVDDITVENEKNEPERRKSICVGETPKKKFTLPVKSKKSTSLLNMRY